MGLTKTPWHDGAGRFGYDENRPQTAAPNSSTIRLPTALSVRKIRLPAAPHKFTQATDINVIFDVWTEDFES